MLETTDNLCFAVNRKNKFSFDHQGHQKKKNSIMSGARDGGLGYTVRCFFR